jgi:4'-phosphopantetheinyl transferase EntD
MATPKVKSTATKAAEAYRAADRALRAKHLPEWEALLAQEYQARGLKRRAESLAERETERARKALKKLHEAHPELVREIIEESS